MYWKYTQCFKTSGNNYCINCKLHWAFSFMARHWYGGKWVNLQNVIFVDILISLIISFILCLKWGDTCLMSVIYSSTILLYKTRCAVQSYTITFIHTYRLLPPSLFLNILCAIHIKSFGLTHSLWPSNFLAFLSSNGTWLHPLLLIYLFIHSLNLAL